MTGGQERHSTLWSSFFLNILFLSISIDFFFLFFFVFCKVSLNAVRRTSNSQRRNKTVTESSSEHFWFEFTVRAERDQAVKKRTRGKKAQGWGLNLQLGGSETLDDGSNAEVLQTDTACGSAGGGAAAESSGRSSAGLLLLVKSDSRLARGRRLAQT